MEELMLSEQYLELLSQEQAFIILCLGIVVGVFLFFIFTRRF